MMGIWDWSWGPGNPEYDEACRRETYHAMTIVEPPSSSERYDWWTADGFVGWRVDAAVREWANEAAAWYGRDLRDALEAGALELGGEG